MLNTEDIVQKLKRKSKEFDKEYASGNYGAAVSIYDHAQEAADFLEIDEADVHEWFGVKPEDRNRRIGVFDNHKVMVAKTKVIYPDRHIF